MQTTQNSMLKSLWAVQAFLNNHAAQLGGVVVGARAAQTCLEGAVQRHRRSGCRSPSLVPLA